MVQVTRVSKSASADVGRSQRPGRTIEEEENQLISLATARARQQLQDGTASSQVITHYLKLGSPMARLERERLEHENELLKAKTEAIRSEKRVEELYRNALGAMKTYSGNSKRDNEDEYYDDDY